VSTLWTPSGEHEPEPQQPAGGAPPGTGGPPPGAGDEPTEAEMAEMRRRLAETPVVDVIANHAIGLWQLAVLHLSLEGGGAPQLDQARLAIDAMAALVEGLGDDLEPHQQPLQDALAQLRLAFVEVSQHAGPGGEAGDAG
jgi:hypothetical protein